MATQTGTIKFRGSAGDLIGYRVGNTHYLRSMPKEVRQSPRSKISSHLFGKASKLGAAMRHAMNGLLDTGRESTLVPSLLPRFYPISLTTKIGHNPKAKHTFLTFGLEWHCHISNYQPCTCCYPGSRVITTRYQMFKT